MSDPDGWAPSQVIVKLDHVVGDLECHAPARIGSIDRLCAGRSIGNGSTLIY